MADQAEMQAIAERYTRVQATLPADPSKDTPAQADVRSLLERAILMEQILPQIAGRADQIGTFCASIGVMPEPT